jgi:hypothetical protein
MRALLGLLPARQIRATSGHRWRRWATVHGMTQGWPCSGGVPSTTGYDTSRVFSVVITAFGPLPGLGSN